MQVNTAFATQLSGFIDELDCLIVGLGTDQSIIYVKVVFDERGCEGELFLVLLRQKL